MQLDDSHREDLPLGHGLEGQGSKECAGIQAYILGSMWLCRLY